MKPTRLLHTIALFARAVTLPAVCCALLAAPLRATETPIAPLDGSSLSSTFETGTVESLPAVGWTNVNGAAQVFDVANGEIIGTTGYGNYEVQLATGTAVLPNTHYRVRVKMGFVAGIGGGAAGYTLQLGTLNGGNFAPLGSTTGTVGYLGNLASGVVSGTANLNVTTGDTVTGDPLAVRWRQDGTTGEGFSDFFGIDDVVLAVVTDGPGDLDPLDLAVSGNYVQVTAVQPDGKTIIAGNFISVLGVPRSNIARLNADGTLDMGFDPKANSDINAMVVQPDGKVVIGGSFTTLQPNGATTPTARQYIARLNADGTLDTDFDPKANNFVYSMALQPDGKVLLGGEFTTLQPNGAGANTARQRIARLNADGTLDTGFDPKLDNWVGTIAVQADGKVLFGGRFTTVQPNGAGAPTARQFVARVNADGTLDAGFDPKANNEVDVVALQADGKVVLGGRFTTLQPNGAGAATARQFVARVNIDGTLDTGFDPKANALVFSAAVQADGKVLLAGNFTSLQPNGAGANTLRQFVARVNADGTLDASFDPKPNNNVIVVAEQADGKVLLAGYFTTLQPNGVSTPTTRNRFARVLNDPPSQILFAPNASQAVWLRGGSAPDLSSATFELSTDGGMTWGAPIAATRAGASPNWQANTLSLPATGQLRARGMTNSGANGSYGLIEQVTTFSIPIPEIDVTGNGTSIPNGDSTPSTADHTHFGEAGLGDSAVVRIFTIANTGPGALHLTGTPQVVVGGANAADFSVTVQPASPVAPTGGTTAFQVAFAPGATGLRSATLSIASDDYDENPYTFSIAGFGTVSQNADLSALTLSSVGYTPAFATGTTAYAANVSNATATTTVTATGANIFAALKVQVNGGGFSAITSGVPSGALALNIGANTIDVKVTAPDGTTTRIYTVSITRSTPAVFSVPELMYYRFDGSGNTVPNFASSPVGANPATIQGALTQGGTGQFGGGLIGSGNSSATDFLDTGWATNLSGSWTISIYLNNIQPSATLCYFFGDFSAGNFRCFTNGVAGPNNLLLRGPGIADVKVLNAALPTPTVTTFVYDAAVPEIRAYLNGVLVNTIAQGAITVSGDGPFKVNGYNTNVGSPAGGVIDEFRMYNRALSATEIFETWNASLPTGLPPTPIEAWRQTHFGSPANSGAGADDFDFDHDGLSNLVEFAFGLDPTQPGSAQLPQLQTDGSNLFFIVPELPGVGGITYGAEWSTNLAPGSWTDIPDTGNLPIHLFTIPAGTNGQLFLRLKITTP